MRHLYFCYFVQLYCNTARCLIQNLKFYRYFTELSHIFTVYFVMILRTELSRVFMMFPYCFIADFLGVFAMLKMIWRLLLVIVAVARAEKQMHSVSSLRSKVGTCRKCEVWTRVPTNVIVQMLDTSSMIQPSTAKTVLPLLESNTDPAPVLILFNPKLTSRTSGCRHKYMLYECHYWGGSNAGR